MLYAKLQYLRSLVLEIERLENERTTICKSRNTEKKEAFFENLKNCKKERDDLISCNYLENLSLFPEELRMAQLFFYKGKSWKEAYELSELMTIKEYRDDNAEKQAIERYKKYITREIQKNY